MKFKIAKDSRTNITLAMSMGFLFGLSLPPVPSGITAFIALVPILFLMERMKSGAQVFRYSYFAFLVLHITSVYWISGWTGDDPWLKVAGIASNLVHPLFFTIPWLFYYYVRKRVELQYAVLFFPLLWVAFEWLAQLPELSFPWLLLANSQTYDIHKIQFITFTGTFGITLWLSAVNAIIFFGLQRSLQGQWSLKTKSFHSLLAGLILLIAIPEVYSRIELDNKELSDSITVGICQPNVNPYDKWADGETPLMKVQKLMEQYDSLVEMHDPELIIMPETAIPFRILMPSYEQEWTWLKQAIDSVKTPLLSGFPFLQWYEDGEAPSGAKSTPENNYRYDDFNAAMLIRPLDDMLQIYKKTKLTPMSERIPYLNDLPFLADILSWGVGISNWGIGDDTTVFSMRARDGRTIKLWPMICYETLYPGFVSGFVGRGANFLCVITNDGWFGPTSGPYQLKQYAVLRAIENRRAIARSANNGISCFISPYGEISQETELYSQRFIAGTVALRSDLTIYSRYGDWLPIACSIIAALLYLNVLLRRKERTL
jgi:apolipoprotein N-acyltransferase